MQVMHRSPVLGQSLTLTKPTASTINTTAKETASPSTNIPHPSSTSTSQDSPLTSVPPFVKRGHKYHVASACVNCKKAHLACDVSRPCKRCVLLEKTDTCLDIKHKKRGRPKLSPKKPKTNDATIATTSEDFSVMRGTIQTPNVDSSTTTTDRGPSQPAAADLLPTPQPISFCHQPIEAFQKPHQGNTYLKSIQVTRLTLFSPTPTVIRTNNTLTITFDQHADANKSTLSSTSPSSEAHTTLVLTMELCCARVSDNITMPWGYYPQELTHRSLYDFIDVEGATRLSLLHRSLLDNAMETSSVKDINQRQQVPPSTERTTSDLFHQKTINELSIMANGSHAFADSLNIKTRSGINEPYNVCAYLGGGLGADMDDVSTLTKLYIIMVCQKKNIVKTDQDQQQQQQQQQNTPCKQPLSASSFQHPRRPNYKTILPLLAPAPAPAPAPASSTSTSVRPSATTSPSLSRYATYRNRPIQPKPHDLRQVSLPAHFANNSSLNTISFGNNQPSPKINMAPSSSSTPPSIPYTYFRSIVSAPATTISASSSPTSSSSTSSMTITEPMILSPRTANDKQTTLTTIAYRPTSSLTSIGHRKIAPIHHPTAQYFSQTSSSKSAQDHAPGTSSSQSTATPRKQGMSIHSLLC